MKCDSKFLFPTLCHSVHLQVAHLGVMTMVLSVLVYGSKTWTLYKRDVRCLDRFHLQCLQRILGIQWSDKVPNTDALLRASAQGMESAALGWSRLQVQLLYGRLKLGKRRPGRRKLRYRDTVKINLCNLNLFSKS